MMTNPNQYHSDTIVLDPTSVPNPDYVSVDVVWIPKGKLPDEIVDSCGFWYNCETGTLLAQVYEKDLLEWLLSNVAEAFVTPEIYTTWHTLFQFLINTKKRP